MEWMETRSPGSGARGWVEPEQGFVCVWGGGIYPSCNKPEVQAPEEKWPALEHKPLSQSPVSPVQFHVESP